MRLTRIRHYMLSAALLISGSISGCSSGGGSDTPTTRPPVVEPIGPTIQFSGSTQPAVLNKTNAADFVNKVLFFEVVVGLAGDLWVDGVEVAATDNRIIEGPDGGSANLSATIDASGFGFAQMIFQEFTNNGVVINGRYIQRFRGPDRNDPGIVFSRGGPGNAEFDSLSVFWPQEGEFIFNGVVVITGANRELIDVNVEVTKTDTDETIYFENCEVRYTTATVAGNDRPAVQISGNVNDAAAGRLQVSPIGPLVDLRYTSSTGVRIAGIGGGIALEGSNGTLELHSLSRAFAAIVLRDNSSGTPESRRYSWTELYGRGDGRLSVASGPIANAGNELHAAVGDNVTVHGMYSHDDDGDWLTFEWQLLEKPVGSAVQIVDTNAPSVSFVPDEPGEYLFLLRASDGIDTTETTVAVQSTASTGAARSISTATGSLEVAPPAGIGLPVLIDARSATNRPYESETGSWSAETEDASSPVINPTGVDFVRSVTTNVSGLHTVRYVEDSNGRTIEPIELTIEPVDVSVSYTIAPAGSTEQ